LISRPHTSKDRKEKTVSVAVRDATRADTILLRGREAPPPKRPRGRPVGSGTRKRKGSYESDDTQDDLASEMEDDETE